MTEAVTQQVLVDMIKSKVKNYKEVLVTVENLDYILKQASRYEHLQKCHERYAEIYPDLDKLFYQSIDLDVLGEL